MLGILDVDDVTPVKSSACGGGSDCSGSGLVKPKEAKPSKEIGQLGITLSGDCSRVSASELSLLVRELGAVPGR